LIADACVVRTPDRRIAVDLPSTGVLVLAQEAPGGLGNLVLPFVFLALLYVLLIRPQSRRRKELTRLVASLQVGDLVATLGGVHGAVVELDDATVDLAVTEDASGKPDVIIRFDRAAIARVIERASDGDDASGDAV
jgi:preprotein translocase subunit YajC